MRKVNVAVVGVTGAVGEVMLEILESRDFPVDTLCPLASARSAGKSVQFRGKRHVVQDLSEFDFSQTPIYFSQRVAISALNSRRLPLRGCVVADNTSHFRRDDDIPLVILRSPSGDPATAVKASSPTPTAPPSACWWRSSQSTTLLELTELTWRPTSSQWYGKADRGTHR